MERQVVPLRSPLPFRMPWGNDRRTRRRTEPPHPPSLPLSPVHTPPMPNHFRTRSLSLPFRCETRWREKEKHGMPRTQTSDTHHGAYRHATEPHGTRQRPIPWTRGKRKRRRSRKEKEGATTRHGIEKRVGPTTNCRRRPAHRVPRLLALPLRRFMRMRWILHPYRSRHPHLRCPLLRTWRWSRRTSPWKPCIPIQRIRTTRHRRRSAGMPHSVTRHRFPPSTRMKKRHTAITITTPEKTSGKCGIRMSPTTRCIAITGLPHDSPTTGMGRKHIGTREGKSAAKVRVCPEGTPLNGYKTWVVPPLLCECLP